MPARNRTGPSGRGPRTGRGLGGCRSSDSDKKSDTSQRLSSNIKVGRNYWAKK